MVRQQIQAAVVAAVQATRDLGSSALPAPPAVAVEVALGTQPGDYFTDVAIQWAAMAPLEARPLAERILAHLTAPSDLVARAEATESGRLCFHLQPQVLEAAVAAALAQGSAYGRSDAGQGRSLQVEFVSANPNAPLQIHHGRAAALGDVLATLLEWNGWRVTREYYINDGVTGAQLQLLGQSLYARYRQLLGHDVALPEYGYSEEYVVELARAAIATEGDRYLALPEAEAVEAFTQLAVREILAQQQAELRAFGVEFDEWFSEAELHASGALTRVIDQLRANGYTYSANGALWLRSTALGDEEDRVLIRHTGVPTYLAADGAYHYNKHTRGFDRVIDILGPDHHSYAARVKALLQALGISPDWLTILTHAAVRPIKGGAVVRTSRRAGELIPLDDIVAEVGRDTARFLFLTCRADRLLNFDIDQARQQSRENPAYAVQWAHARLCSLLRTADTPPAQDADPSLLGPAERCLLRCLLAFPGEVTAAAAALEPHRLAVFALGLADEIHAFCDDADARQPALPAVEAARRALAEAARIVLGNTLRILGIAAPDGAEAAP